MNAHLILIDGIARLTIRPMACRVIATPLLEGAIVPLFW